MISRKDPIPFLVDETKIVGGLQIQYKEMVATDRRDLPYPSRNSKLYVWLNHKDYPEGKDKEWLKDARELALAQLIDHGARFDKASYSRTCGCRCGCSPGFTLKGNKGKDYFVTISKKPL